MNFRHFVHELLTSPLYGFIFLICSIFYCLMLNNQRTSCKIEDVYLKSICRKTELINELTKVVKGQSYKIPSQLLFQIIKNEFYMPVLLQDHSINMNLTEKSSKGLIISNDNTLDKTDKTDQFKIRYYIPEFNQNYSGNTTVFKNNSIENEIPCISRKRLKGKYFGVYRGELTTIQPQLIEMTKKEIEKYIETVNFNWTMIYDFENGEPIENKQMFDQAAPDKLFRVLLFKDVKKN